MIDCMKKTLSLILSAALTTTYALSVKADAATDVSLWDKFIRYDLCITDYNSLTDEEKELCHFIFDTEQAAGDNIVCERARRTLAGDDVGERITIGQLEDAYGVWDYGSFYQTYYGWHTFIDCVPDVICLDLDRYSNSYVYYNKMEYWLDDERSSYVLYLEKVSPDTQSRFEVYDGNDDLIETIPVKFDCPMKDFRGEKEYMEDFGMIEKNGGWYYTKPDGTAVFAWSNYSGGQSAEKITEPFVIESEINGCPVTAIEKGALAQAPFTEIVLPDPLKVIERSAFASCQHLEKINFPEGLEYIGKWAFFDCNSMTDLTLNCPELVIADGAFYELKGLKTANINAKDICESAVSNCKSLESITLGDSVENIKYGAFGGNICLTDINIPNSVKTIGQEALVNFTSVTIPPTVKIIGSYPPKTPQEMTSGIEPPPPVRPLTDKPKCAFNDNCIIYGYTGTEAERYAEEWGLEFVPLEYTEGDANFDGKFTIADVVTVQNYLLGRQESELAYWKAADFCDDNSLDVFDLCLMRRALINSSDVAERDDYSIAGKIFAYEKEGAGGYCTLSFNENGRFLYSPGKLSSYMSGGDWKIDGDIVSLIGMVDKTIYLKISDDTLVYIAEGSDEFPYMDIKDGEKFGIYRPEISSDKFQLNSRYSEYGLGNPKVELNLIVGELPEFCYVENVGLYDENDNFIGTMSPAMDADIWDYLVDYYVTEECSKTYYTLTKIRCGEKTYLDDVRSEITVNFKVAPAP